MNASEVLRIVDSLHREKSIEKEIVFRAIESALVSAARKYFGEEKGEEVEIDFVIDRDTGAIDGSVDGEKVEYEDIVGRIGAQTAKQVIIQKVREAERDALLIEYEDQINELVSGVIERTDGGTITVNLGSLEAILPRGEQIPGETHHVKERVRAVISEVKTQGSRVRVILSRTRPVLVQRLFEQEIPEIIDGVIEFRGVSREPGFRSKVAVSSSDSKVDCVGACVGVRGSRIKNIVDELSRERIDIVRFDEDPQVMIPNALQPAEVDEVILCEKIGRAIVLVREDQLSLAIGKRGQNVRLASKLCGWDVEIMTQEELESQIERAVIGFSEIDGIDEDLANALVGEGYLSYDDLEVIEPDVLMEMGELTEEQVDAIVEEAEKRALDAETAAAEEKRRKKMEEEMLARQLRANPPVESQPAPSPDQPPGSPSVDAGEAVNEMVGENQEENNEENSDAPQGADNEEAGDSSAESNAESTDSENADTGAS
ncbi:MAG: transcription termination factor NusA [Planctomycetota bacterium]|nr:transcription termination factor NusA [Planctomycetota bacterium]